MTKLEVAKLVGVLIASFPNSKVSPETSLVYERMLADLDYPAANAAVERLLATARFMPTIAEIRESALTLERGEVRAGGEAWGEVLKAIGRYGYVRQPGVDFEFSDATTVECVRALNWRELCESENPQADRARFIELYDKLAATQRRKDLSGHLPAQQRLRALREAQRLTDDDAPAQRLIAQVVAGTRPT